MKYRNLIAFVAWPLLASCAAKTPAVTTSLAPAPQAVALAGGLRVTPLEATTAEVAEQNSGIWKFKIVTPKSNKRVICEVELLRGGHVVERLARMGDLVPATTTESEILVAANWPSPPADAPAKMVVAVTYQNSGTRGTRTVNDSFASAARGWNSVASPQKDGSFLLVGAGQSGYSTSDVAKNEINLVCRFRLNDAPIGKFPPAPAPIPFELAADKVDFKRADADLLRQGFAYQAKIAIGYRGPRPDWWGRETGVNWNYDQGLALADGKGQLRRVPTSNGTLSTGGSQPHYNSELDKYVNTAVIAHSEMKGRAGKLVFVQEMLASRKPAGAIYQTISAPQFALRRQNALAKVKILAAVPPL